MGYTISAVNGMSSWIETFAEVGFAIGAKLTEELNLGLVDKTYESQGRTGLYELAVKITNEFEELNRNRLWDGEFFDEIDEFIHRQLNPDEEPEPGAMTNQELFNELKELNLLSPEQIRAYIQSNDGKWHWNERSTFIDMLRKAEESLEPTTLVMLENSDGEEKSFYKQSDFIEFVGRLWKENEEEDTNVRRPNNYLEARAYLETYCTEWFYR